MMIQKLIGIMPVIKLLVKIYVFINLSVIIRYQVDDERIIINNIYDHIAKREIELEKIDQLEKGYDIEHLNFINSWSIFQFSDKLLIPFLLNKLFVFNNRWLLYYNEKEGAMDNTQDDFIDRYNIIENSIDTRGILRFIKEKRGEDKIFKKNALDSLKVLNILRFKIDEACFENINCTYSSDSLKHCLYYDKPLKGFDCIVISNTGQVENYSYWDSTLVIKVGKHPNNLLYNLRVWYKTGHYPDRQSGYNYRDIVRIKKEISNVVFILNGELCFYKNGEIFIFDNRVKEKVFRFDERYGKKFNRFHISHKKLIIPGEPFSGK